jgi:hypothetical protein
MSDVYPTPNRIKAVGLLARSSSIDVLSPEDRKMIEDAIEQDLDAASRQVAADHGRLQKLEGQVEALSDAVIAIAEPSDIVDGAVQTVKDKM